MPGRRKWRMPQEAPEYPYEVYEIEDESENFEFLLEQARVMQVCAIDTETTSNLKPDKKKGEKFFDWAQGARAFMATFCASDDAVFATYDPWLVHRIITELDDLGTTQVYQNCKFDLHHLREWANYSPPSLEHSIDDTMFGFRLKFPRHKADLKTASGRYVTLNTTYWQEKVHDWLADENGRRTEGSFWYNPKKANFSDVPKELMLPYASTDAWLTLKSWYGLREDGAFNSQLYRDEVQLAQLLVRVERAGWRVKKDILLKHVARAREEFERYSRELDLVCPGLDVFSSQQLTKLFYEQLGEPVIFTTSEGNPSTSETALLRFTSNPMLRDLVLGKRHWQKTLDKLQNLEYFVSADQCVHSVLKNEAAKTGRFGSENPNLQNLDAFDKNKPWSFVREVFGPEDGFVHVFADYKQIEMVIFADYTQDPGLCNAIRNDLDLHTNTASLMFQVPYDDIKHGIEEGNSEYKLYRKLGKGMNFTIIFGAGGAKVGGMLRYGDKHGQGEVDLETIEKLIGQPCRIDIGKFYEKAGKYLVDLYFKGLPLAKDFIFDCRKNVAKRTPQPWVTNKFGRVIPVMYGQEYAAVNYLVQGTAADLMKNSMRRSWKVCEQFCKEAGLIPWQDVQLFITIHDDLGFKIREDYWKDLAPRIKSAMCDWEDTFSVPVRAEFALVTPDIDWAHKEVIEV